MTYPKYCVGCKFTAKISNDEIEIIKIDGTPPLYNVKLGNIEFKIGQTLLDMHWDLIRFNIGDKFADGSRMMKISGIYGTMDYHMTSGDIASHAYLVGMEFIGTDEEEEPPTDVKLKRYIAAAKEFAESIDKPKSLFFEFLCAHYTLPFIRGDDVYLRILLYRSLFDDDLDFKLRAHINGSTMPQYEYIVTQNASVTGKFSIAIGNSTTVVIND